MSCRLVSYSSREDWLDARLFLGVGSSEAAALFARPKEPLRGMSSWESVVSLNFKKRGKIPQERDDGLGPDPNLEWSRAEMEPAVSRWFERVVMPEKENGNDLTDPGDWTVAIPVGEDGEQSFPWFCTVDRLIQDRRGVPVSILEIKNASAWIASDWTEEPPIAYQIQVQAQLAIFGLPYGYICASIGGTAPRWARVEADEEMQRIIRDRIEGFWRVVQADEEPDMDAHPKTAEALTKRWSMDDDSTVALPESVGVAWDRRCELGERIKAEKAEYDLRTNRIKAAFGAATYGELPDGRVLSCKADKRGRRMLREWTTREAA